MREHPWGYPEGGGIPSRGCGCNRCEGARTPEAYRVSMERQHPPITYTYTGTDGPRNAFDMRIGGEVVDRIFRTQVQPIDSIRSY
jgi:hypothetical protein